MNSGELLMVLTVGLWRGGNPSPRFCSFMAFDQLMERELVAPQWLLRNLGNYAS